MKSNLATIHPLIYEILHYLHLQMTAKNSSSVHNILPKTLFNERNFCPPSLFIVTFQ